ncbi:hypothetical protein CLU79DRAFT_756151 [Phycomyces nitens]|nr:hypothetical protein CLU79DRAFT_756151 [Phycomyces nitens]
MHTTKALSHRRTTTSKSGCFSVYSTNSIPFIFHISLDPYTTVVSAQDSISWLQV